MDMHYLGNCQEPAGKIHPGVVRYGERGEQTHIGGDKSSTVLANGRGSAGE